ncbi:MAG TPA: hypothetical protein VH592_20420 [Gemmataceae bacterium]|jgi:hypothetical protein
MSHQTPSPTRIRFFRPSLEWLEERNLLSNAGFTSFLNGVANTINQNIEAANILSKTVNTDTIALNAHPHNLGFLVNLEVDCLKLIQFVSQTQELMSVFSDLELFGQTVGLVTNDQSSLGKLPDIDNPAFSAFSPDKEPLKIPNPGNKTDTEYFDAKIADMQKTISNLQSDAQAAGALMVAALSDFLFGTGNLPSLPSSAALAAATVSPSVTESISPAPSEASAAGGPITESVTVNNPGNSAVHVAIDYSCTDGSSASTSDDCTNGSITVPLEVDPSAAGNTGTWTVSVTGQPTQTNTTTWTA